MRGHTLYEESLHSSFHQFLSLLQLLLVRGFLRQKSSNVRVRRLYHGIEGVGVAFRAVPSLQPRYNDLRELFLDIVSQKSREFRFLQRQKLYSTITHLYRYHKRVVLFNLLTYVRRFVVRVVHHRGRTRRRSLPFLFHPLSVTLFSLQLSLFALPFVLIISGL